MPETTLVVQGSSGLGQTGELGARMAVLLEITLVVQARCSWDRRNTMQEGYNWWTVPKRVSTTLTYDANPRYILVSLACAQGKHME